MPELAEGARLEIVCPAKSGTEGSNPSLSATNHVKFMAENLQANFTTGESRLAGGLKEIETN